MGASQQAQLELNIEDKVDLKQLQEKVTTLENDVKQLSKTNLSASDTIVNTGKCQ